MRLSSLLVLVPLATLSLYACHDEATEPPAGYEDVEYGGDVTDETLVGLASALDQKEPIDAPAAKAVVDMPADMASLPKSPVPTFQWHIGTTASRSLPGAGTWAGLDPSVKAAGSSFKAPLRELFGPPRAAHAHGTPFTGTATYLVFSTDSAPTLVRVLTSELKYTPTQEAWTKITGAGKAVTLTLMTALFTENRVDQDGGPFKGGTATFTIAP